MKKIMLVLMITFCIGLRGKTKKCAISVYRKLIGDETHGKLIGFGSGVTTKDLRAKHQKSESKLLVKVLNKMLTMQNQIDVLTTKVASQGTNSQPESVRNTSKYVFNLTSFAYFLSNVHELCIESWFTSKLGQ